VVALGGFRDRVTAPVGWTTAGSGLLVPSAAHGAVVHKQIEANVSASQIKTKQMCTRKWWFEKVCGLRASSEQKHFKIGHILHSIAERYLMRSARTWADLFPPGWDKDLEEHESMWMKLMAELAVTNGLWQSSDSVQVEYPLVLLVGKEHLDHRGIPKVARADTYMDKGGVRRHKTPVSLYDGSPLPVGWDRLPPFVGFIDVAHLHTTPAVVEDHKTAKSRKYALTSEKLAQDLQVLSYACLPVSLHPGLDQVRLRHNIFLKDPDAKTPCYSVQAFANVAMIARNWNQVIADVEEMGRIRSETPALMDPEKPLSKGANWHKVPCAIDEGRTKDACDAYGGCPMKDVCFGRASIEQVAARMTGPDPLKAFKARQDAMSFNPHSMRTKWLGKQPTTGDLPAVPRLSEPSPSPVSSPPSKDTPMPFPSRAAAVKPIAVHDVVYLIDPENTAETYKGSITNAGNETTRTVMLALWPDLSVEPDIMTIGEAFVVSDMPWDAISRTQIPVAQLVGYAGIAASLFAPELCGWKPRPTAIKPVVAAKPVLAPTAGSGAESAKVPTRAPHTGGGFASRMTQPQAPATPAPIAEIVPTATYIPVEGQRVMVLPSTNAFWAPLYGKQGVITSIGMSDVGDVVNVDIEGLPYPDVAAGRFSLVQGAEAPMPRVSQHERGTWKEYVALVGRVVSVKQVGSPSPLNGALEAVAEHGITMMNGAVKLPWDRIEQMEVLDPAKHVPGYTPPKATKEEKAAAKEAATKAKIEAKMKAAADKVLEREKQKADKKAADKAAKDAAKVAASTQSATAVPVAMGVAMGAPGIAPALLASVTPGAGVLSLQGFVAPTKQPLFRAKDALPQLDAAIQALERVRTILSQA